jgi:hypothetical protein
LTALELNTAWRLLYQFGLSRRLAARTGNGYIFYLFCVKSLSFLSFVLIRSLLSLLLWSGLRPFTGQSETFRDW